MRYVILLFVTALPLISQNVPVLRNPTVSQTVAQPPGTALSVNNFEAQYINGIAQADQFPGTDMCAKIAGAISSMIALGGGDVDATHFSGTQPCSEDPFSTAIPANWGGHLSVRLGHVRIESTQAWVIANTNITLIGISPTATQLMYTGSSDVHAVLTVSGYDRECSNARIENLYLIGNGNGTDRSRWAHLGLFALKCFRSEFNNIWAWGIQDVGIYIQGGVSNSLRSPRVSKWDASNVLGTVVGAPHSAGIQLDSVTIGTSTWATTAGTISDAAVEGVPGTGILCAHAINILFLSGTSENNGHGVFVGPKCLGITFIGMDLELNKDGHRNKIDLHDEGTNTALINVYSQNAILLNGKSTPLSTSGLCRGTACWLTGSFAPGGSCNTGSLFTRTDNGDFYLCKASTWVLK